MQGDSAIDQIKKATSELQSVVQAVNASTVAFDLDGNTKSFDRRNARDHQNTLDPLSPDLQEQMQFQIRQNCQLKQENDALHAQLRQVNAQRNGKPPTCYRCGLPGHISRFCWHEVPPESTYNTQSNDPSDMQPTFQARRTKSSNNISQNAPVNTFTHQQPLAKHPSVISVPFSNNMCINGTINHYPVKILTDSGASLSCIHPKTFEKIRKNTKIKPSLFPSILTISGMESPIVGTVKLSISLGDMSTTFKFHIVEIGDNHVIIGRDFLNKNGAIINVTENKVKFKNNNVTSLPFVTYIKHFNPNHNPNPYMPKPKPKHQKSKNKVKVKVKHRKKERKKHIKQESNFIVIDRMESNPPIHLAPSPRTIQQMNHENSVKWLTFFRTVMIVTICLLLSGSLLWFLFQSGCSLPKIKQRMKPLPEPHCQNYPTGKIFILIKNPSTQATLHPMYLFALPTTPETGIGIAHT